MDKVRQSIPMGIAILLIVSIALSVGARQTSVKGYYRKDGTYVSPHMRNIGGGSRSSYSGRYPSTLPSRSYAPNYDNPVGRRSIAVPGTRGGRNDDAQYDAMMKSLKQCGTVNEDGTACRRKALPGNVYCYLHAGLKYQPGSASASIKDGKNNLCEALDPQKRRETIVVIDRLRAKIDAYMDEHGDVLPSGLEELARIGCGIKDAWGHILYYEKAGRDYALASDGDDSVPNTADDIIFSTQEGRLCQKILESSRLCGRESVNNSWYCSVHKEERKPTCQSGHSSNVSDKKSRGEDNELKGLFFIIGVGLVLYIVARYSRKWRRMKRI